MAFEPDLKEKKPSQKDILKWNFKQRKHMEIQTRARLMREKIAKKGKLHQNRARGKD